MGKNGMKRVGERDKRGAASPAVRFAFAAALLFIIALTTVGCGGREQVIRVGIMAESNWNVPSGTVYDIIDLAAERFEAEHPGVRVEYTGGILKEDYSEWLAEQLLLGTEPDVFMILSEDFHMLASLGALEDLSDLIQSDPSFDGEAYYPAAYAGGQWEGRQMALAYECVPRLMFVNRSLLEEAGVEMPGEDWTWEDFYEICRQVTADTDGNGVLDRFGCYNYSWTDAVYANGQGLFDPDGTECYVGSPAAEEAVLFVEQLNGLNQGAQVSAQDFDLGNVAFQPLLFSEYRTYSPYPWRIKKYTGFEWECLPMPAGPSGANVSEMDVLLMGISSRCSDRDLAWEFLKLMTYDAEIQEQIFSLSQGASGLKSVVTAPETAERINADMPVGSRMDMELLDEIMETAVTMPSFRKYEEAMSMLEEGVAEAMADDKNIHSSLVTLQRRLVSFLRN